MIRNYIFFKKFSLTCCCFLVGGYSNVSYFRQTVFKQNVCGREFNFTEITTQFNEKNYKRYIYLYLNELKYKLLEKTN
jgi:hypothetical protein